MISTSCKVFEEPSMSCLSVIFSDVGDILLITFEEKKFLVTLLLLCCTYQAILSFYVGHRKTHTIELILFFLLDSFFIYISNVFPFPGLPFRTPLSHPHLPRLLWGCSLTHLLPSSPPGIPLQRGIEHPQAWGPLLPLMSNKAIFCHICGQSHGSLHVYALENLPFYIPCYSVTAPVMVHLHITLSGLGIA